MTEDRYFTLDGHEPVPCSDLLKWARWFQTAGRHVAQDEFGDWIVSTVFLGIDHRWGEGPPILFETMAFKRGECMDMDRCATWTEAEKQHARVLARIKLRISLKVFETARLLTPRRGKLRAIDKA